MKTKTLIIAGSYMDPQNKTQVANLIERADATFRLAAKEREFGNNSGNCHTLRVSEARSNRLQGKAEAMLAPLGIKCSYPGLYPVFEVNGFTEYSCEMAVLSAIGHPRNWLRS